MSKAHTPVGHGKMTVFVVTDYDGNVWGVYLSKEEAEKASEGKTCFVSSQPLDVNVEMDAQGVLHFN
jgi:cyclopropane fatty-acyl-phospholipid synthase-like methyltransferase